MQERAEIEKLREAAMEEFENSAKGIRLDMKRKVAEAALRAKLKTVDHELLDKYIDNITEFFFEEAVYIFHKAHR